MVESDINSVGLPLEEVVAEDHVGSVEYNQPQDGTYNLNGYVDGCDTLCLTVNTEAGEDCSHTGSDIGTHNNWNSHTQCNLTCHG